MSCYQIHRCWNSFARIIIVFIITHKISHTMCSMPGKACQDQKTLLCAHSSVADYCHYCQHQTAEGNLWNVDAGLIFSKSMAHFPVCMVSRNRGVTVGILWVKTWVAQKKKQQHNFSCKFKFDRKRELDQIYIQRQRTVKHMKVETIDCI